MDFMTLFTTCNFLASKTPTANNPFAVAAEPVIELIKMAAGPVLGIVAALGIIYCIFLGVKLAKAEEQQDREKAKGALKNFIIGFLLIFILIVVLMVGLPAMVSWVNSTAGGNITVTGTK